MTPTQALPTPSPSRLLNRELASLDWNLRLLDLASDPDEPLLERVRYAAFVSINLDQFFMVRVAGLLGQIASGVTVRSPDGRTAHETLDETRARAAEIVARQARLWVRELVPELAAEGICVGQVEDCDEEELAQLEHVFERELFPVLTPLAVGPGQRFPYISGLSLSLGVWVRDPGTGEARFARVKVPEGMSRFASVGSRGLLIPIENVIAHYLPRLFPGMEILERAVFRVTRDADFTVSDEADDLLEAVEAELARRRFGDVVRLEVSSSISSQMLLRLRARLGLAAEQVYSVRGLLDMEDLMDIAALDYPELKYAPWVPAPVRRFSGGGQDLFAEIASRDILVHHPYDSFASSVEAFVTTAAKDPDVAGIKTTVYRTSHDSALAPALIECAEDGKQTVCLVELKARFDEQRNIVWSRALEQAGVHVVHGFPDLKIHAKTTLILRREGDRVRRYVHIGTGNYHAHTARHYEDFGLFTADPDIAADVADLFNYVTGFARPQPFRKLLVAPFNLRDGLIERIREVATAAASGERARIRMKVNSLIDERIIDELYLASQAGASIDIVARSIVTLRPGIPQLSDNIRVRSLAGRFLEHSRVFAFEAGEQAKYLFGSADLMPRNLDHRIEVVTPVEDPKACDELNSSFNTLLSDNTHSWTLRSDGTWDRVTPERGQRRRSAQLVEMRRRRRQGRVPKSTPPVTP